MGKVLEMSEVLPQGGRKKIRMILLTIHNNPTETNENGIHWDRQFVERNMDSLKGAPICATFMDEDRTYPYDHGLTGSREIDGNREPIYQNSDVVGVIEEAHIEEMYINDINRTVLVADGYIYYQRYPDFVNYVQSMTLTDEILGSIEIMGTKENNNHIIYVEDAPTDTFRTPKEFVFSGYAILGVPAGDRNAYVLEVAQKQSSDDNPNKEEFTLDEKQMKALIAEAVGEVISEQNQLDTTVAELNEQIGAKAQEVANLTAENESLKNSLAEVNQKLEEALAALEPIQAELNEMKSAKAVSEMEDAIAKFSDEEKAFAEAEINSFKENPLDGDISVIENKIYAGIGAAKVKADADAKAIAEANAKQKQESNEDLNIFGGIDSVKATEDIF